MAVALEAAALEVATAAHYHPSCATKSTPVSTPGEVAGTGPDWPYWTPCEWFRGLPSCHLSDSKGRWLAQGRLWDLGKPLWGTRNRSTSNLTRSRCEGGPTVRVACWVGRPPAAPALAGGGTGAALCGSWLRGRRPSCEVGWRLAAPAVAGVAPAPPSGSRGRVLILLLYLFYRVLYWLFYWVWPLIKSVDSVSQTQPYVCTCTSIDSVPI